jgi:SAM-dependent methyltransferase
MDQAVAPTPHITQIEISSRPALADTLRQAFEDALAGRGEMDDGVYRVNGFCGRKHRLFVNNLIRRLVNPRYLEIGIFRGATLCAAIADNKVKVVGVDNWTEYGGKANEFYTNLAAIKGEESTVTVVEQDFRTVDYAAFGPFNVGFYDGPHSDQDQYDGARIVLEALESPGILLVDDWNWQRVRNGTMNAIRDLGRHVEFAIELRTSFDDKIPAICQGGSDWHNGAFAAVVTK